jgi:hypothetical protein
VAVQALLLDHGLGHAQLVDPVVQRGDVLLERSILQPARRLGLDGGSEPPLAALLAVGGRQVGELVLDQGLGRFQCGGVSEAHLDGLAVARDRGAANVLVAQARAQVIGEGLGLLVDGALHVDLQQEVHAAAQVQAQVHGVGAQRCQPGRRARHQIEGHHVGRVARVRHQRALQHVARLELVVGGREARPHRGGVERDQVRREAGSLQRFRHAGLGAGIDLDGRLARRHLHCRRLAEEIGQGVDQPHEQHDDDDRVLPDRVTVHDRAWKIELQPVRVELVEAG